MTEPGASMGPEASAQTPIAPSSAPGAGRGLNLVGSFRHNVDEKRRVAIPRALRDQVLASGERDAWVICRSLGGDKCLDLFPADRFGARLAKLEAMREGTLGVGNKAVRAYLRAVRESASEQVPDKQGRIVLTDDQRALASIDREATFVGAGESVELWAPDVLERVRSSQDFEALAREIFG